MVTLETVAFVGDEVALAWGDAEETYVKLEGLRRACPCAACQGEADVRGLVIKPSVQYEAKSFKLLRYEVVGGYALQMFWADGHSTGIFTFDYLRKLGV